ncbi:hypothetical protein ABIB94_007939 [Bradyrhizobium sp. JR7.2]
MATAILFMPASIAASDSTGRRAQVDIDKTRQIANE